MSEPAGHPRYSIVLEKTTHPAAYLLVAHHLDKRLAQAAYDALLWNLVDARFDKVSLDETRHAAPPGRGFVPVLERVTLSERVRLVTLPPAA